MKEMNELVSNLRALSLKGDSNEIIEKTQQGTKYILTLKKNNKQIGQSIEIPTLKYESLKKRAEKNKPGIISSDIDKLIWSLMYRYKYILPIVPDTYKKDKNLKRITDDPLPPHNYKSIFYDLEQYFGSTGI
jgi:hypothetical protein